MKNLLTMKNLLIMKNLHFYLFFAVLGFGCSKGIEKECLKWACWPCSSNTESNPDQYNNIEKEVVVEKKKKRKKIKKNGCNFGSGTTEPSLAVAAAAVGDCLVM